MIPFFFYGSNMCLPFLHQLGVKYGKYQKAILKNYSFIVNVPDTNLCYGYANVIPKSNECVEGLWIEIPPDAVKFLDEYENFPIDYLKKEVTVWVNNCPKEALLYYGNPDICVDKNLLLNEEQLQRIQWIKNQDIWSNK